jgi:hypothetical protein
MPTPTILKLTAIRGDATRWRFTLKDPSGNPVNTATVTAMYFTGRRQATTSADDTDALFQRSLGAGITAVGAAEAGQFDVVLAAANTRGLAPAEIKVDLQAHIDGGEPVTPAIGTLTIVADITRRAD